MRARELAIICMAVAAIAVGFVITQRLDSIENSGSMSADSGVRDTVLTNGDGQEFPLAASGGKWLILFFGYASCPDVCPMSLAYLNRELTNAGQAADSFQPIFISVDPRRDRPEVLKRYVAAFSNRIIGATGSPEALDSLSKRLGVYYEVESKSGDDKSEDNYTIVHSGAFFVISPAGKLVKTLSPPAAPGALSELMRQINAEKNAGKA
ncbi:MAG: hypothetical protein RL011_1490 [Pseudomonadota bacterium]